MSVYSQICLLLCLNYVFVSVRQDEEGPRRCQIKGFVKAEKGGETVMDQC